MRADLDNDGYIPTTDLAKTQSVERKMVDGVMEDAGTDILNGQIFTDTCSSPCALFFLHMGQSERLQIMH